MIHVHKIVKHSICIGGLKTSVSMEEPFWHELQRMAREQGLSVGAFIKSIGDQIAHRREANLSSALRQLVLADIKETVTRLRAEAIPVAHQAAE